MWIIKFWWYKFEIFCISILYEFFVVYVSCGNWWVFFKKRVLYFGRFNSLNVRYVLVEEIILYIGVV